MARKTKAEAELTRRQIIAAARKVFVERGVSRTTLAHIAAVAGVTRGAIYWHFANKMDLFDAMRDQVSLPLIDRMDDTLLGEEPDDPLQGIEKSLLEILRVLANDEVARQTFEIMLWKCEYVNEFSAAFDHVIQTGHDFVTKLTRAYECARDKGQLRAGLEPAALARDTHSFIAGLVHLWLADREGKLVRSRACAMVRAHMALRRA